MMSEIPHTVWVVYLLILLVVILVGLGIEGVAVLNAASGDTLTELTRQHANVPVFVYYLAGGAAVGMIIWAVIHFPGKWGI